MILRACFPYAFPSTKSPLIGTEPKKSFEAWPRTVPFYDVVTWKKMPGASNGAGSVELARVKSPRKNRKEWFHSHLEKRAARNMLCGMVSW